MNDKNTYIRPEIETITLDKDISIYLASSDSLPPTGVGDEGLSSLNSHNPSDPFKNTIG